MAAKIKNLNDDEKEVNPKIINSNIPKDKEEKKEDNESGHNFYELHVKRIPM